MTATLGAILYRSAEHRRSTNESFNQETQMIALFHRAQIGTSSEGGALASYVLLREPRWIQTFQDARRDVETALESLRVSIPPNEAGRIDDLISQHDQLATQEQLVFDGLQHDDPEATIAAAKQGSLEANSIRLVASVEEGVAHAQRDLQAAQSADRTTQLSAFRQSMAVIATWGLIVVALAIGTLGWLVRPLRKASEATEQIAAGDLNRRVPESGPSELARLGSDVNQLTAALVHRSEELTSYLSRHLEERTQELEASQQELIRIASTDQLIKIFNRRAFLERASEELKRCRRENKPISLAMFDIDRFKLVNDEHGHPTGDAVLADVARRIDDCRRGYDVVGRWGGEEFVALFPDLTSERARQAAKRMALAVSASPIVVGSLAIDVRVSGGVVSRQGSTVRSVDELIEVADEALLRAKRAGRDRIEVVPDDADSTELGLAS